MVGIFLFISLISFSWFVTYTGSQEYMTLQSSSKHLSDLDILIRTKTFKLALLT